MSKTRLANKYNVCVKTGKYIKTSLSYIYSSLADLGSAYTIHTSFY